MTSEPDSTPRRRPPTIDLTATEVAPEKPASAQHSDAVKPAAARAESDAAGGLWRPALGAGAGVVVTAAVIAALWFADYLPARETTAPPRAQSSEPAAIDAIAQRLDKIQDTIAARPPPEPELGSRMAAVEAATKALGNSLAALNQRVDEVAGAAQSALAQAKSSAAAADAAKSAAQTDVQRGDLDALAGRIAALESTVKTLTVAVARQTTGADDRAARLNLVTAALRAAVERGAPYLAELAAVRSLGVGQDELAPLEPFAASGVPTATALAHELALLTPALLHASGDAPSENTYLGRLETSAQRLVRITPIDAPPGDDPAAVIARINADAAHADIAGALADIARLPEAARTSAAAWTKKAEARNAAIAASRRIAADALATLANPTPQ